MSTETLQVPLAARVRHRLDELVGRLRHALDLPSRAELMDLTRRLEELDRRIAALAAERVEAMSTVIPALPESTAEAAAPIPEPAAEETASEPAGPADPETNGSKRGAKQRKK
jgi:hypothetical protein